MRFLLGLIFAISLSVFAIKAQNPIVSPTPPTDENKVCGLTSPEIVTLNVSVWSKNKGYLKGLNYKDFEVFDGKDRQDIEFFSQKDEPISVGILFDLSASMQSLKNSKLNEVPFAIEGLISFINKSNPQNEYFIVGFAREVAVLLEPTQDKKQIESTLKTIVSLKPDGSTSVYGAINTGFDKISSSKFNKKILLVISDGVDNNSKKIDVANMKKKSKQNQNVMISLMNIITDEDPRLEDFSGSKGVFETLTENSGGQIFYPKSRRQVIESFETLADELKNQYIIGFVPKDSSKEQESWHKVKINVNLSKETMQENGKVFVRAQKGFYF
jgi:Ca-activated chloride channel homolog